jgi:hypothetical protein
VASIAELIDESLEPAIVRTQEDAAHMVAHARASEAAAVRSGLS